jgi:hypothetical protein
MAKLQFSKQNPKSSQMQSTTTCSLCPTYTPKRGNQNIHSEVPKCWVLPKSQKHHINPKTLNTQKNFFVKILFEIPKVLQHSLDHWSMIVVILGILLTSTWDNGRKSRPQYKNQPIVSTIWHSCLLKQLIINSILESLVNPKTT